LYAANIPVAYKHSLFRWFFMWCVQTDMLQVVTANGIEQTRYQHLLGRLPGWTEHMQIAGMAGYVKTHTAMTPKTSARGKKCLFVCYAEHHAGDCYVMYDPKKRSILHSRDVLWLNKMYFKADAIKQEDVANPADEGSEAINDDSSADFSNSSSTDGGSDADTDLTDGGSDGDNDSTDTGSESSGHSLGQDWQYATPEETVEFNANSSDDSDTGSNTTNAGSDGETPGYRTRTGRRVKQPVIYDGTTRTSHELAALDIEEEFLNEVCLIGLDEAKVVNPDYRDEALTTEECILMSLTKEETIYSSIERAFGYVSSNGHHMLVAAALEDNQGEVFLVGATGKNYGNTAELNVMNYKQAMATVDKDEWDKAVEVEHNKMLKYNVFKVVNRKDVPKGVKMFDSAWAMKKKADGTFRARNAIRGFKQIDGLHYDSQDKSSPVATEVGIRIVFVLSLVFNY